MAGLINVDLSVTGRLTADEGKLLVMSEHFDQFIVDWEQKHPSIWRDRIGKGVFPLYNGTSQKTNVFRGTLGPQAGIADWEAIAVSKKASGANPGIEYCSYKPQTYTWAYESFDFTGYRSSWRSPSFCVNDLKFIDKAKEQLGMIIRAGSQVTDASKETFNREMYVKQAVDSGKAVILAEGGMDYIDSTSVRFSYNPATEDANGDTYITFPVAMLPKISTLNWTFLDYIRAYMSDQCPDAAQGSESGMPLFGLMLDLLDFERFVLNDDDIREDVRFMEPRKLITGFNMGFKIYRGFILMHDSRQMRYVVQSNDGTTVTAVRVLPRRATKVGTVGYIPESNPGYIQAELALGVIFIADVVQILVPPTVNNMGSGMVFGPAPDYNGSWTWLNIADEQTNPLNEIGYFFARFEYYVKPLQWANEATVFLYRRCPQALKTGCEVEDRDDVGVGAVAMSTIPVAADIDTTNRTVTLTLAKKLDGGIGTAVTINTDDGDDLAANIFEDHNAPTYTFGWATGASNAPSAITELNDPAIVTVTVA